MESNILLNHETYELGLISKWLINITFCSAKHFTYLHRQIAHKVGHSASICIKPSHVPTYHDWIGTKNPDYLLLEYNAIMTLEKYARILSVRNIQYIQLLQYLKCMSALNLKPRPLSFFPNCLLTSHIYWEILITRHLHNIIFVNSVKSSNFAHICNDFMDTWLSSSQGRSCIITICSILDGMQSYRRKWWKSG